jgi:hypothetical protein
MDHLPKSQQRKGLARKNGARSKTIDDAPSGREAKWHRLCRRYDVYFFHHGNHATDHVFMVCLRTLILRSSFTTAFMPCANQLTSWTPSALMWKKTKRTQLAPVNATHGAVHDVVRFDSGDLDGAGCEQSATSPTHKRCSGIPTLSPSPQLRAGLENHRRPSETDHISLEENVSVYCGIKAYFRWIENVFTTFTDHTCSNIISRDIYIIEFVHDATENYYEREKYGCWNSHVTKTPLFILEVPKLLLFYLPILMTMCFFDLFSYKIPMYRKWVRLKCVLYLLLDAFFWLPFIFLMWASSQITKPSSKTLKKSTLGR